MSEILLAKPTLPDGFIDVSVGEPHIVRENLLKIFSVMPYEIPQVSHMFEYPDPKGYKPLVQMLEEKHKAPVIITNGAKQALGACFYALQKMGRLNIAMSSPYWALIPPLVEMHGLNWFTPNNAQCHIASEFGFLLLAPNNPDGFTLSAVELMEEAQKLKDKGIPLIHDAAYYTHVYLPQTHSLPSFGDVQVYSISKMLGLSGLRLGYVVCHNKEFYKLIQQYMEAMTVGVSIIPQIFLADLFKRMNSYPTLTQSFEGTSSNALAESKRIVKNIDPEILEVPQDFENTPGMFGWFKVGPKADFEKSKVNFIDGALFGVPGCVRMNLAFSADKITEIVNRLNSVK